MLLFILILAASSIGVHSLRCVTPANQLCAGSYNQITCCRDPYESPPILPCEAIYLPQKAVPVPVAVMPETTVYLQQTTMPVIPFITELPNCPDFCFNEILMSPLGCLDPILTIYGTSNVYSLPELPVSPLLPAASPVCSLTSSFSKLMPPVCDYECYSRPIPPPFI